MEFDLKKREIRVTILLTPEERAELKAAAEKLSVREGTYIRMKALEAARSGEK